MKDVLIAGGGPVGLATALYAARAGLDVAVVEPRSAPIDKACGEGLMPGAVAALQDLDVTVSGMDFRGIRYTNGTHEARALFSVGMGRGVERTELHAALHSRVLEQGIPIIDDMVTAVEQHEDRVQAAGFSAKYLIGADGLHSPVRRLSGMEAASARPNLARWGQRCHFDMPPWSDLVEVHWSEHAEAYVTPLGRNRVGVAVLSQQRGSFTQHLAGFPDLVNRIAGIEASPVRGAGPLRQASTQRVRGRVLLVGDAAGYVDALTGEGLAVGFASARQLIGCIRGGQPARYEKQWLQTSRRYRMITGSLLWAARKPVLRKKIVPLAAAVPPLFGYLVRQIAR
ncbi:NAD(P)/FAD-dependent oxidoreductase [Jatrophihabitans sp. DSM 45814]